MRSDDDEFGIDMSGPFTERVEFGLGQRCVNCCVAKKGTAEVKWDKGHEFGEVCSPTGSSDELETEKSQLWDRARIGVDHARTNTLWRRRRGCDARGE